MTLDMKESNVLGSETERDLKGQGETLPNELLPYVLVFLIRSFRDLFADKKELLARRVYPDGRVKPIRIKGRKLQI